MTEDVQERKGSSQPEQYTLGYGQNAVNEMAVRQISREASFFAPYLHAGMSVLDCGCGPGTIALGMAEVVAPGEVVGIDVERSQVEEAEALARERGITNARFQVASVYELPFPDESFDAVLAHAVLEHLSRPLDALREIYRILKRGGVIGTRSPDQGGWIYTPSNPILDKSLSLGERLYQHNGGDRRIGRRFRGLLHQAGFVDVRACASYRCHGTEEEVEDFSERAISIMNAVSDQLIQLGWASRSEMEEISTAWRTWGKLPDAFMANAWGEAIGWKSKV